jgi:hypothetical protein
MGRLVGFRRRVGRVGVVGVSVVGAVRHVRSCSDNTHTTRAVTLWWMIVMLSSPTTSIPNS